ncbi:MAG: ABC transporter permease [Deltaproteobacteria bacterium]|nr:ABC transporter permease [Deltaproteobacteria bacterium]
MLRRLWHIMLKEFIQVWRDRRLRLFLFLPPLVQLVVYGYAINFDLKHVPTAVYDEDRSPASRDLVSRFRASEYFQVQHFIDNPARLRDLVDRGEITLAVRIPPDFARRLKSGKTASLQLIIDATDSNAALITAKYASLVVQDYSQELLAQRLRRLEPPVSLETPVAVEARAWFNPNLISRTAFVPGVIAMVVMLVSLMLTALAVVREKEIGTMEQILVTPIRPVEFLLGKTVPFILISLADVALVTLLGVYWFEVPFRGSVLVLFVGTLAFLFNSVGLGLFISTVSSTQQQAMMAGTFLLTPAILLSGLIFPIANMPPFFQHLTLANPLRYFVVVVQSVFLKDAGFLALWPQMAAMTGLGLTLLFLSVMRFRSRLA